ncbi:phenylacetate-CoA ligase [Myxococcaceae bacterium]|jgi:phenylacetate-CoA ligase|nr:phenylacetate-CoA ligase [Myxococcaceae bacterium]
MTRHRTEAAALETALERARSSPLYAERLRGVSIREPEDLERVPLTTRADLQRAGVHGTRAVPLDRVCHYGETSGTTGASNSTWLTAEDLRGNARAIAARHPELFGPGRVLLNRFPFMAAPAHLIQLIAQEGGGISVPAGNINWDVPFPRALDLAITTGAQVLVSLPVEPIVLERLARERGLDPANATRFDAFFLGGAPLPPAMRARMAHVFGVRVVELYGSTETMLLGTGCPEGTLHLETDLVHVEVLECDRDAPVVPGREGRLVVTTLAIEGSPLVRFETGDLVRELAPCKCGDPRLGIVVLGRTADELRVAGAKLHPYDVIDVGAEAAASLDSSVFFVVVLRDRILVRIESETGGDPAARAESRLGVPVEIERVAANELLDVELLTRSPRVYKPVVLSDWQRPGRRIVSLNEGMIEWPKIGAAEAWRWLRRNLSRTSRRRRLLRSG